MDTDTDIKDEKFFLHEISNTLNIAEGMTNFCLKKLTKVDDLDEKIMLRLDKSHKAIKKSIEFIVKRREEIS